MDHFAVDKALSTMAVLCDTREQDTLRARKRFKQIGVPIERAALSFGDYSVRCDVLDLRDNVAIERKMDLSELALATVRNGNALCESLSGPKRRGLSYISWSRMGALTRLTAATTGREFIPSL